MHAYLNIEISKLGKWKIKIKQTVNVEENINKMWTSYWSREKIKIQVKRTFSVYRFKQQQQKGNIDC